MSFVYWETRVFLLRPLEPFWTCSQNTPMHVGALKVSVQLENNEPHESRAMTTVPIDIQDDKTSAHHDGNAIGYRCAGQLWRRVGRFYGRHEYHSGEEWIYQLEYHWYRGFIAKPEEIAGPFASLTRAMQAHAWVAYHLHQRGVAPVVVDGKRYLLSDDGRYTRVK